MHIGSKTGQMRDREERGGGIFRGTTDGRAAYTQHTLTITPAHVILSRMSSALLPPPAADFITVKEIALTVGVRPYTVRTWIALGRLPAFRMPKGLIVKRRDLEMFIESCRVTPAITRV